MNEYLDYFIHQKLQKDFPFFLLWQMATSISIRLSIPGDSQYFSHWPGGIRALSATPFRAAVFLTCKIKHLPFHKVLPFENGASKLLSSLIENENWADGSVNTFPPSS